MLSQSFVCFFFNFFHVEITVLFNFTIAIIKSSKEIMIFIIFCSLCIFFICCFFICFFFIFIIILELQVLITHIPVIIIIVITEVCTLLWFFTFFVWLIININGKIIIYFFIFLYFSHLLYWISLICCFVFSFFFLFFIFWFIFMMFFWWSWSNCINFTFLFRCSMKFFLFILILIKIKLYIITIYGFFIIFCIILFIILIRIIVLFVVYKPFPIKKVWFSSIRKFFFLFLFITTIRFTACFWSFTVLLIQKVFM